MTRGVPVIEALLDSGIPYTSGPEWLAREVLRDQHVLAVAGTHGKTTTSSMLAWILEHAGLEPGFLIGGVPGNFSRERAARCAQILRHRSRRVRHRVLRQAREVRALPAAHRDPQQPRIRSRRHLRRTSARSRSSSITWCAPIPASGRILWNHRDTNLAAVLAMGAWTPRETFSKDSGGEGPDAPAAPNWTLKLPAGERRRTTPNSTYSADPGYWAACAGRCSARTTRKTRWRP